MRIIPDKATIVLVPIEGIGGLFWKHEDTIEITDAQLDEIVGTYIYGAVSGIGQVASGKIVIRAQPFSQYLRDLISLTGEGR